MSGGPEATAGEGARHVAAVPSAGIAAGLSAGAARACSIRRAAPRRPRPDRRGAAPRLRHHQGPGGEIPGRLQPEPRRHLPDAADAGGGRSRRLGGKRQQAALFDHRTGQAYLAEQAEELAKINAQIAESSAETSSASLGDEIKALTFALFSRLRSGALSGAQAEKARDILKKARRELEDL